MKLSLTIAFCAGMLTLAGSALADDVTDLAAHAQELDDASRLHGAPLTKHFKALGPSALPSMLALVAKDPPASLTPSARIALRHGMIEAIGMLRDKSATPVLVKELAKERDAEGTRVVAEALARIGDDDAWKALKASVGAATGDRERAILSAMGSCRREEATQLLADRLDKKPDAETARVLVKALGTSGNAAAWKALVNRTDEAASRSLAARALVRAFVAYDGAVRQAASNALLVVDYDGTPALLAEARKGGGPGDALDALEKRFARNPTSSSRP